MDVLNAQFPFLTIIIVLPLVAALILWVLPVLHKSARVYGLAVALIELVLAIVATSSMDWTKAGVWQLSEIHSWIPSIGVSYAVAANGLAMVMVILAVFLVPLVLLAAWYEHTVSEGAGVIARRQTGFVAWVLVLESFMVLIFVARDLLLFYICFEAMLIPVYFLIGIYGGPKRRAAALKFLLYSLAGGLIMLVGVIGLYVNIDGQIGPQAFIISTLAQNKIGAMSQVWIFLTFFIAFAIKAPMWPIHTWLPDTTEQATPGTSTLLVGVLDKVGTYGMLVICLPLFPQASQLAAPYIMVIALVSIIVGALIAIGQKHLMRLIAYTSISHFGFMVMGIYSGNKLALSGAMLYMVAHGVATGAMFIVSGMLYKRGGSYDMFSYGGWQRVTPVLAGSWLIAGLASIALPGISGFVPEYLTLMGVFQVIPALGMVAVIGAILASVYVLLPYQRVFTGPKPEGDLPPDVNLVEKLVIAPLLVVMLILGFIPGPVLDAVNPSADQAVTILHNAQNSEGSTR